MPGRRLRDAVVIILGHQGPVPGRPVSASFKVAHDIGLRGKRLLRILAKNAFPGDHSQTFNEPESSVMHNTGRGVGVLAQYLNGGAKLFKKRYGYCQPGRVPGYIVRHFLKTLGTQKYELWFGSFVHNFVQARCRHTAVLTFQVNVHRSILSDKRFYIKILIYNRTNDCNLKSEVLMLCRLYRLFTWLPRFISIAFCFFLISCSLHSVEPVDSGGISSSAPPPRPGLEAAGLYDEAFALWRRPFMSVRAAEACAAPEKAVALLDKAIALEPGFAEAYIRRGLAKSELNLGEAAFDDLTTAIRLYPTPEAYAYRALACMRSKQERAALRDLSYALKLNPTNPLANNISGLMALKEANNNTEACVFFKKGCSGGDCSFIEAARLENLCK